MFFSDFIEHDHQNQGVLAANVLPLLAPAATAILCLLIHSLRTEDTMLSLLAQEGNSIVILIIQERKL